MSASASVITSQAQGVTVPTQAVTGTGTLATVQLLRSGKTVSQPVIAGLRGTSRTQIVSGVNAGQQLVVTISLPALGSTTSTTGGSSGTLGGTGLRGAVVAAVASEAADSEGAEALEAAAERSVAAGPGWPAAGPVGADGGP